MLSAPNDYYFGGALQGQQSKYYWADTATILRTVEKYHKSLENRNILTKFILEKNFFEKTCKIFHKTHRKEPLMKSFLI